MWILSRFIRLLTYYTWSHAKIDVRVFFLRGTMPNLETRITTFASWRNCVVVLLSRVKFDCCLTIREDTPKSKFVRHYARHFYFTTRTCRVSLIVVLLYVKARWIDFTRIMSYNFVPRIAPIVALLYVKARQKSMCARLNFTSTIWSTYKTL